MLAATLLTLAAALLHASWNLLIKTSGDRALAAWGQFVFGGLVFVPVLVVVGLPDAGAWPFLIASGIVHVAYVEGLVRAYHHGDFSFAYPLARGTGAVVAALGGAVVLGDALHVGSWVALTVVVLGLLTLVGRGVTATALSWAAATGVMIGTYTILDADGARRTSNGFAYGVVLTIVAALCLSVSGVVRGRGPAFVASLRSSWPRYVMSGIALTGAYSLVLVAVRFDGVRLGYVATLRESSVVLGAALGWLVLGERMGRSRVVSSLIVLVGMIGLVVAQW